MLQFEEMSYVLSGINAVSITVRLAFATLLGGIIGLERGLKGRPAGMRTYMLVCVGATLVMITNAYLATIFPYSDPARMGAQVISGIGFLGAGTIIITRDKQVRGLTTAAGLWASACMGLAIGVGFYTGAVIGTLFIFFVTTVMHRLDSQLTDSSRSLEAYVELADAGFIHKLEQSLGESGIKATHIEVVRPKRECPEGENRAAFQLSLQLPIRRAHYKVILDINAIEFVSYAEEA